MKYIGFLKSNWWGLVTLVYLFYLLIAFVSQYFIPQKTMTADGFPWIAQSKNVSEFSEKIANTWDTKHFTSIAVGGYGNEDTRLNFKKDCGVNRELKCGLGKNYLYAFFPLFPIILAVFSHIAPINLVIFLVSFILYIIFAGLLICRFKNGFKDFKVVFLDSGLLQKKSSDLGGSIVKPTKSLWSSKKTWLTQTLLLSLLLPFSIFFVVPYTETLYLSLFLLILNLWQKQNFNFKNYILLFVLSLLLGLSRSVAVILPATIFIFLIYELLRNKFSFKQFFNLQKQNILKFLIISAGVVSAFLAFFYYGFIKTGNFFVSRNVQELWGRGSTLNILEPIFKSVKQVMSGEGSGLGLWMILGFVFFSVLIFNKYKNLILNNSTYFLMFFYSIFAIILPLTSNSTASINRYILAAPIYFFFIPIYLNNFIETKIPEKLRKFVFNILIIGMLFFFCVTAVLWSNHYWIG